MFHRHLKTLFGIWVALISIAVAGCSKDMNGSIYQNQLPKFDLASYFDGTIKAWGIVQDRSGQVVNRFDADIEASQDGDTIVLDEVFRYYDAKQAVGQPTKRVWRIEQNARGYWGTAGDILGQATGTSYGNALQWTYDMALPVNGSTYRVRFDDWIWAMNDDVIINRSYIKKFGITWAEVTIFMQKQK